MRSRPMLILLLALVTGLVAVVIASRWISSNKVETTPIVVLAKDVPMGSVIAADMLQVAEWPKKNLPIGSFSDNSKPVGRVATAALIRGEPLLDARLASEGTKAGLSAIVTPGKRAMTVAVNDVVGVAGFVLPGTHVDVLINTRSDGPNGKPISKIMLSQILVLAAAQEVDRNASKPVVTNAVTLEVTPEQAEALDLARSVGTLSLVLRNQNEKSAASTQGMTKDALLGIEPAPAPELITVSHKAPAAPPPAPVAAPAPRKPAAAASQPAAARAPAPGTCVDIIRGPQKVTECF